MAISITGNTLEELEQQLAALRNAPSQTSRNKIEELKRRTTRTTGNTWRLIKAVAHRGTCTLAELATDLHMNTAGVHSIMGALGRPCQSSCIPQAAVRYD